MVLASACTLPDVTGDSPPRSSSPGRRRRPWPATSPAWFFRPRSDAYCADAHESPLLAASAAACAPLPPTTGRTPAAPRKSPSRPWPIGTFELARAAPRRPVLGQLEPVQRVAPRLRHGLHLQRDFSQALLPTRRVRRTLQRRHHSFVASWAAPVGQGHRHPCHRRRRTHPSHSSSLKAVFVVTALISFRRASDAAVT